jgi:hypothetical protein
MGHASESIVNQATISARAEALEKKEADGVAQNGKGEEGIQPDPKEAEAKAAADKAAADKKVADDKAEADRKAAEDTEAGKVVKKPVKKEPNDPEEMRKWSTRVSQENSKLRKEMSELKEAQEKTYKLLASLSKNPVDYKELAKNPEALQKFVEEERDAMTSEFQGQIDSLSAESKAKDTAMERMRREHDTENYPEWKRIYPEIVKLAMGPAGTGDPRIDFTKPASEILDALYEIALQEHPVSAPAVKPAVTPAPEGKTFSEAEVKAMVSDMVSKEKEAIAKTAKEEAIREAQEALRSEAAGGTVASAGRGAGRVPTDQLAAFKKMTLGEQKEWLIANSPNGQ